MATADSDLNRASIKTLANASLPLLLPLARERVNIGTGFDSQLACENASPWRSSIFSAPEPDKNVAVVELREEQHSYRANFTFTSHQTSDHFSGALGITVGNAVLSGGVSGKYDSLMTESNEGTHDSKIASAQVGRIVLKDSVLADALEKAAHGKVSRDIYGDYFVYGYVLGAERAINLNVKSYAKTEKESKEITVKVKLLFIQASKTWTESKESSLREYDLVVMGYDTLRKDFRNRSSKDSGSTKELVDVFMTFTDAVKHIQADVTAHLQRLGLRENTHLTRAACDKLFDSGLVKQLVLLPYRTAGFL